MAVNSERNKINVKLQKKLNNNCNKFNTLTIKNSLNILNNKNIILLTLIIMIIPCILSKQIKFRKLILSYEITIKVGAGDQRILNDTIESPDQIFVNGNSTEVTKILTNLEGENTIKMVWYSPLSDISRMFYCLGNILEINLSNFDSSQVTSMSEIFLNCESLTSIDFTNFNTSKVNNFSSIFFGCKKF